MVFFFARWLLIAYSSKNDKKKEIPIKSCQVLFFWGFGWGGEQAKICASNDINDKICWSLRPWPLETQTLWPLERVSDTDALALFCFLSRYIFISLKTNDFFRQKRIISVTGIREYGNTSSSEPTIDFQGSMDANDSSTCRWLLISGKTIDSANTDANYRRCQKCETMWEATWKS